MIPASRERVPSPPAVRQLRRRLFGASLAVTALACAAIMLWGVLGGVPARELSVPLAGTALALAAELLCLGAAIRRVERLVGLPPRPSDAVRDGAGGAPVRA